MRKQFRQGDVYLFQVQELPKGAKFESTSDRIVLAYGEATWHSHSISPFEARAYNLKDDNFLVVDDLARLVHEEHNPIFLPAGVYRVVRQKEYDQELGSRYVYD